MDGWKEFELSEAVSTVIDYRGKTPKKLGGDWSATGYRALSARNIKTGKIVQSENIRFVPEKLYRKWMKIEIQRGDIIITSEAPFGQVFYWDSDEKIVLSQRLFAIRVNPRFYSKYVYFYMTSSSFQAELDRRATGTTVVGLRQPELLKCRIFAPGYDEQKKIADLLWYIEEKINNNEKINKNLEAQAQALYQKTANSVNMGIPNGTLSDICDYSKDRIAVSELETNNYYSTENMLPNKGGAIEAAGLPTAAQATKCHEGDTLISNIRPYFKKILFCEDDCGCSADVLCFTPNKSEYAGYLFSALYSDKFFNFVMAGAKGTKMPRGDKKQIMAYPIVVPNEEGLRHFNGIATPILRTIKNNRAENNRLVELREFLLPKLMSGEVDVSKIEI